MESEWLMKTFIMVQWQLANSNKNLTVARSLNMPPLAAAIHIARQNKDAGTLTDSE